jgi:hypothetical protein
MSLKSSDFAMIQSKVHVPFKISSFSKELITLSYFFNLIEIDVYFSHQTSKNKGPQVQSIKMKLKTNEEVSNRLKFCVALIEHEIKQQGILNRDHRYFNNLFMVS